MKSHINTQDSRGEVEDSRDLAYNSLSPFPSSVHTSCLVPKQSCSGILGSVNDITMACRIPVRYLLSLTDKKYGALETVLVHRTGLRN